MQSTRIIRRRQLVELINVSPSTLYRMMRDPRHAFPRPLRLSAQAVGWDMESVNHWIQTRAEVRQ